MTKILFKKGNIPKNKGKVSIRKCDFCSFTSKEVFKSKKFGHLLCDKHYWHFVKWGEVRWEVRPLKTPEPKRIKGTLEMINWRKKVFERDNFTCQECGVRGKKLEAHHIKPYKYFPELRSILSNGLTLCVPCHKQTDTWGRKGQKIYAKGN